MPTLRQLLFLATGLIIGCYFFKSTNLLALNTGALSDATPLDKDRSTEKQTSPQEEKHHARINDTYYSKMRLWIQTDQRIVENRLIIGAPVKKYCVYSEMSVESLRQLVSESDWDPIDIRKLEEIFDDEERILDLCGVCPPIVQLHQNHSSRLSKQVLQEAESQASIFHQMVSFPLSMLLLIFCVLIGAIISWDRQKVIDLIRRIVDKISPGHVLYETLKLFNSGIAFSLGLFSITSTPPHERSFQAVFIGCFLTLMISSIVLFIIEFYCNVWRSEDKLLVELDQLLQQVSGTQRIVENRLAAGASRNDLRVFEEEAESAWERVRYVKPRYESITLYRLKYRKEKIVPKVEEILDVCERIVYLCRPAPAA